MPCFRWFKVIALLLSLSLSPALAQRGPVRGSGVPDSGIPNERTEMDNEMRHKLQKQQQKKRFDEMKRDSQTLLELATQLKQYVDNSGENILSVEVVRKAEEMEKLARQIKNKMRGE